jgi:hypothetical protein
MVVWCGLTLFMATDIGKSHSHQPVGDKGEASHKRQRYDCIHNGMRAECTAEQRSQTNDSQYPAEGNLPAPQWLARRPQIAGQ